MIHQSAPRICSRLCPERLSNFCQRATTVSYLWGNVETKTTGTSQLEFSGQSITRGSLGMAELIWSDSFKKPLVYSGGLPVRWECNLCE